VLITVVGDPRLEGQRVFCAALRARIADPPAIEHGPEQYGLLCFGGRNAQQLQQTELVLWNLPQRRVGGADQAEDFSDGGERYVRAAVFPGNADAAQAAAGELFDFRPWQLALLVAAGGLL